MAHLLSSLSHKPPAVAEHPRRSPFLEALEHVEFGRLTLVTPEGSMQEFAGPRVGPSAQLTIYDWGVFSDLVAHGEIGFADAYIEQRWDSENLPNLLTFGLMNSPALERFFHGSPWYAILLRMQYLLKGNSLWGSRRNIMAHYDLGNDFYALWLDKGMTYSCALFENDFTRSLEDAQAAKYQRVLKQLQTTPGEHILEIGCGWGGFAEAAARQGLRVTAITLSERQLDYAKQRLHYAGLLHQVSLELTDYRKVTGTFDHIVSIGMLEHVGERYWHTYFDTIKNHLNPGGKALIQSITLDDRLFESLHDYTGFIEQVIFPGGMLPSQSRFLSVAGQAGLACDEIFTFGRDYVRTLTHWLNRFHAHEEQVRALGYDEHFLRLWTFYLSACMAAFASGRTDVMQATLRHAP